MGYEHISKLYGVEFKEGMRVVHAVTRKSGEVRRSGRIPDHYVAVRFDGSDHRVPCHPQELKIIKTA